MAGILTENSCCRNELKARLCGFLAADGSVFIRKERKTGKIHHDIRFYPDSLILAQLFNDALRTLYGRVARTKQLGNYYALAVTSKQAVTDLLSMASFTSKSWTLPNVVVTRTAKIEWLRAYFDCDGYVGNKYVQVQSVNVGGLRVIQRLLNEFGIESKIYTYTRKNESWNINYLLNINKKEMRIKFLRDIGFNHPLKKKKLESLISAEVA